MDIFSYLLGKKSSSSGGGTGGLDWTAIGYTEEPQSLTNGYLYAKEIYDNWVPAKSLKDKYKLNSELIYFPLVDTSITTSMYGTFTSCHALLSIPLLNTSSVTSMRSMFASCHALKDVPVLDTSSLESTTSISNMFADCYSLSEDSLNNILTMCINASSYTGTKTLSTLGFTSVYYPAVMIEELTNYNDFISAGWTIGY